MSITTLSSREFNQKTSEAKHATRVGPVIITERGRPSHVLLTYEAYQALNGRNGRNIIDLLACPKVAELDFEIPTTDLALRDVDLVMYILDTNVISEVRKASSGRANAGVVEWARRIPPSDMYLSVFTIFEIERGILKVARRDQAQAEVLRNWFDRQVLVEFRDRLLSVDARVARHAASLHVPDPRSERDIFIAATAFVHAMTVVTRNVADFVGTGVTLFNPWDG